MLYLPLCGSKQKKQCITVAGNGTFLHLSIKGPLCDVLGRGVNKVSRELVLLFKTLIKRLSIVKSRFYAKDKVLKYTCHIGKAKQCQKVSRIIWMAQGRGGGGRGRIDEDTLNVQNAFKFIVDFYIWTYSLFLNDVIAFGGRFKDFVTTVLKLWNSWPWRDGSQKLSKNLVT